MPMGNTAPLENRITTIFPTLSRAHQKLARLILDNGLFVAFASAAELGKQVGVSNATVVRFCQALGYDGYPELQAAVRANLLVMIGWAALIVLFTAAGLTLAYVGMAVTLPLIGYASWHAYRDLVADGQSQ